MARKKAKKNKGNQRRVEFRRNRTQPARDKSWTRQFREHGFEDKTTASRETMIPKGDLSRKRTIIEGALEGADVHEGKVISMRGLIAEVDDGVRIWPCTIRRVLRTRRIEERNPVAVGDCVQFMVVADAEGVEREGVIHRVLDRRSRLVRRYGGREQVIAANVDVVVIVSSAARPATKPHLIDRYLVSAHAGGIEPLICINKIDLDQAGEFEDLVQMYRGIGYVVVPASATTGAGIATLKKALCQRASVFVGQSGVGKSSLLNAVQPGLLLATAEVSGTTEKGRHTTTATCLLKLDSGGYVVDTPGVRSYDLAAVPPNEYELHFVEFVEHVSNCHFPNCTHIHEQLCAVKEAVERGLINRRRYESYCRMYEEG